MFNSGGKQTFQPPNFMNIYRVPSTHQRVHGRFRT